MAEYIDRQELYQTESLLRTDIVTENRIASYILDQVLFDIQAKPAADVVPVVRCKECKYHEIEPEKLKLGDIPPKQGECWCNWWDSAVNLSGFCSRGERIEE